ncbi:lipase 3-like [Sitophilus oryzae]|uniref:Lipase n=1 Tax=Sitophilus oryzae TaxID=7048 RepID=A0A6J2Y873_SITOR|nr:lipase 3-like [Sitophilus oryzae]
MGQLNMVIAETFDNFLNILCKGFEGIASGKDDCQFDPDEVLDVPQIVRRHGYPVETHTIVTEDGYLLGVHRIPGNKEGQPGNQPVLLQHGLMGSSADWVLNGDTTLAFLLADNGYDVWLNNARGNVYSKAHTTLPPYSSQFWNFSWHEMGTRDLPAVLYHIGNETQKPGEIIYIGHSMGTTMAFVLTSTLPSVAKTVKLFVALAPTVYMTHVTSPVRYLTPFTSDISWLARNLGINQLKPSNKLLKFLSYGCEKKYTKKICENIFFIVIGYDDSEFDLRMLPKVLSHDPAGSSTKTVLHYSQEIRSEGKFQRYDYGTKENMQIYGTPQPPEYKLDKITRPFYMFFAENDIFANPIDVERLIQAVPTVVGTTKVPGTTFGHIDYIFGKNAYDYVYKPLLGVLQNYTMEQESY